jgi:hypothetical protein
MNTLTTREKVMGVLLASTSGAAVMAHAFGPVKMNYATPFITIPAMAILVACVLLRQGKLQRLHAFSSVVLAGAIYGLGATLIYDIVRPIIKWIAGYQYNPFRAMPIFGMLITGLPEADPLACKAS